MGFEEEGGPPEWYTLHVIAERYGCAPHEVERWPVESYQQAIVRLDAEAQAQRSARLKNK